MRQLLIASLLICCITYNQQDKQKFAISPEELYFGLSSTNNYLIMNYPENLRYTKDHEWVSIDGDVATVGITDFAQRELGDIVYVDISSVGKAFSAEEVFGTVEAVKTVSDLFLPLTGTIIEVNPALESQPELVNTDPYGEGWMIKMKVANPADADGLMNAEAYTSLVG